MVLSEAKALQYGDILHHKEWKNADGTPVRFRVVGRVKTWKKDGTRIRVPLKYGLYNYGCLVNDTHEGKASQFNIDIQEVLKGV